MLKLDPKFLVALSNLQINSVPAASQEFARIAESIGASLRPSLEVLEEFKKINYQLIDEKLLNQFSALKIDTTSFNRIAKELGTALNKLSIYNYDLDQFQSKSSFNYRRIEIVDHSKKLIRSIYQDHHLLDTLDPREFEEVIGELLNSQGYTVSLTQQTRDGGYDILALNYIGDIPFKLLVECKRYKNKIGIGIIRGFCDVISREKANKGLLITSSYYSPPAIQRKDEMGSLLDLKNRDDIINWVTQYNLKTN